MALGRPAEIMTDDDRADVLALGHGPCLWRLLIDRRRQPRGYGRATLDAVVGCLRDRPGADILWTSCGQGPGSPQPLYEGYGFRPTGRMLDDEAILRLDLPMEDR